MAQQQINRPQSSEVDAALLVSEERARFRRRVKRISFLVVVIVIAAHFLVGVGASIFVVARYFAKPKAQFTAVKQIEMKPEEQHRRSMEQVESMRSKPVVNNRIQSLKPSALVLPDLPKVPVDAPIPIATNAAAAAQGTGSGQGAGSGQGTGFFGGAGLVGSGLLEGTLYDLKQSKAGRPTGMTPEKYSNEIKAFAYGNWNMSRFAQYFKGPNPLFTRQIYIPVMPAEEGPKAFNVADQVQPKMWVALYHATVVPPTSGRFRFVGCCDDVMIVRFNRKVVLDGSLTNLSIWHGREKPYLYPNMNKMDAAVGDWVTVKAGVSYPIEILIGERPGGKFLAFLFLEAEGGSYQKNEAGSPILPLFCLAGGEALKNNSRLKAPPFDPAGQAWNVVRKAAAPLNSP